MKEGDLIQDIRFGGGQLGIVMKITEESTGIFWGNGLHTIEDAEEIKNLKEVPFRGDHGITANFSELVKNYQALHIILKRRQKGLDPFERHEDEPEGSP